MLKNLSLPYPSLEFDHGLEKDSYNQFFNFMYLINHDACYHFSFKLMCNVVYLRPLAMICCVVGVFALCGWEMGAVEAVSLSILVGSSVDYLVHIVEGYILAAKQLPKHVLDSQVKRYAELG